VCQRLFFLDNNLAEADEEEDALLAAVTPDAQDPLISLHAIAGVHTSDMMQMRLHIGDVDLLALIDSGPPTTSLPRTPPTAPA